MGLYFKTFEYVVIPLLLAILFIFSNGTGRSYIQPHVAKIINYHPPFLSGHMRLFPFLSLVNVFMCIYHLHQVHHRLGYKDGQHDFHKMKASIKGKNEAFIAKHYRGMMMNACSILLIL